jgi:uncharacterized membrane protein
MEFQVPNELLWAVMGVAVIMQFARQFAAVEQYKRFLPYAAIGLGVAAALIAGVAFPACIVTGITIGLMAAGGYDAIKSFGKKPAIDAEGSWTTTGAAADPAEQGKAIAPTVTKLLIVLFVLAVVLFGAGCNPVRLPAAYDMQVRQAAIVTAELNKRCQAGDCEACKAGLETSTETLALIVDGLDAKESD